MKYEDFTRYDGWLVKEWLENLGTDTFQRGRYTTFQIALNLFLQRQGTNIVETGCQRGKDDIGSGCSTEIFSKFISSYGGHLYSVDNNYEHLSFAKDLIGDNEQVSFILDDSVNYLSNYSNKIDLLYLDSYDYPVVELIELYAGKEIYQNQELYLNTRAELFDLGEQEILRRHGDMLKDSQEHCLNEIKAAAPALRKNSIVLIDDANLLGGGKPRLAKEWLSEHGWHVLLDSFQTLWIYGG